ncbi:MAG: riboflavin synthase [Fimbriimonas sp.]|nr:riboflavin synthase [Fimbriimonas sp.]
MYTGIIQGVGRVQSYENGVLTMTPPEGFAPDGFDIGESLAVNGICLTVIADSGTLKFDVSPETLARTSLGDAIPGSPVNLERPMSADGRFGGHMVQGHVDATGTIVSITPEGNSVVYRFQAPIEYDRYLIDKGSVAIDGISLTVVKPVDGQFDVWIIPHTLEVTNLGVLKVGSRVNLEFDLVARYVEKMMAAGA